MREIRNFGRIKEVIELPNLTNIQITSYNNLLQQGRSAHEREDTGLQAAFREVFPIDETERGRQTDLVLDFLEYRLDEPEYGPDECREKDLTYHAGLFAKLQLVHKDTGLIKEDEVFLGDLPLMTEDGSFIINGADRVIVSQIHRSPGVYFTGAMTGVNQMRYTASIIPMPKRGPWIEVEFDNSQVLWMKVNKRKFHFTLLLRVLGYGDAQIRELFAGHESLIDATLENEASPGIAPDEALLRLFTVLRPGDPPKVDKATQYLFGLLADPRRYDLGDAGRFKMNSKLGLDFAPNTLLGFEDGRFIDYGLVPTLQYLVRLQAGVEGYTEDDIDHLGNRRIRTVGELVADQIRVGLGRMARGVRERMLLGNPDAATPQKLVNSRPIVAALREFFGRSQLSQFKDQVNPLSELRHKRRISALGPGGLTRERAGFDVRDVHRTHYGRICPIETPEGANIGLITSLASFARVNELGFIEAPYRRVVNGRVTDEVVYIDAHDEDKFLIAQANTPLNDDGTFGTETIVARKLGDAVFLSPDQVDFMDVSPKQIISVPTSLIPFLEHDDANRALMGSNMQSQAVPLIRARAPFVGTGVEERVSRDSGTVVLAVEPGTVTYVDANRIVIENDKGIERDYQLTRFQRSNQNTNLNQRPVVSLGDRVVQNQAIADGPASEVGRLALGQNVLIALMPFDGYNFEDAIVLSENLVRSDAFTSVHIEKFEKEARDTKLGPEKITRDIPGLSEAALRDLDEDGVVRIGAEVRQGDILVGHTSFKGEKDPTPEERLLRSIFGEKAKEVKDTSLKVPPGDGGIVLRTVRFRKGDDGVELRPGVQEMVRVYVAQKRRLIEGDKLANRHGNKGVVAKILAPEDMPYLADGTPVDMVFNPLGVPSRMNLGQILETHLGFAALKDGVSYVTPVFDGARESEIKDLLEANAIREADENEAAGFDHDERELEVYRRSAKLGIVDRDLTPREAHQALARSGKAVLFDGRTGEAIDAPIVVGIMYIMKLYHMVEDKMHARSTGPYSLITQQPLGGKAQFGGQRLGEMEVWALKAHGAAYTLQEMLTIKSDDIDGRNAAYEAIVKGNDVLEPTIPESFKVLVKELHSLGLDVTVLDADDKTVSIFDETGRHW
ncbi:MAG TPA: DNA-directed RNA polymerase subunit beta [Trueperaceae bacterium]|nr:DNA-directed RNA polymerase subunit beta [Trueperaceae bacterium]